MSHALTASLGVATYPDHAGHADTLVRQADRAMYLAKQRGRDRLELAADPARAWPEARLHERSSQ